MFHRSPFARAILLLTALLSSFVSSVGLVLCTQPDGRATVELVAAGQRTCISCEEDDPHTSAAPQHEHESSLSSLHDHCSCSDSLLFDGSARARIVERASVDPWTSVAFFVLPPTTLLSIVVEPAQTILDRRFVPPRPSPLLAHVRAVVLLI